MERINFDELLLLIEQKRFRELKAILEELNEADVAEFIQELPRNDAIIVFRLLKKEIAADVFAFLDIDIQQWIVHAVTENELQGIIDELFVDDAVDIIEELPANVVKRILKGLDPQKRSLINQFLKYHENSAGGIMTAEFVHLKKNMNVAQAIDYIRKNSTDKESIYTCYVTDNSRILEGVVTVKTLLLSSDDALVGDIMDMDIISAYTSDDEEEVAALIGKYDLLSVPVVDHENRLVGIVTVDDAVDVITTEATEDFEKMGALIPSEKPYLRTNIMTLAKNRLPWLLVLMVSAMFTGAILGRFEAAMAAVPLLITFIPMLTDTGGNSGSQTSTIIIRGMAINEIKPDDFLTVILKEFGVSILVGAVLGLINMLRIFLFYPDSFKIGIVVSISIFVTVVTAKLIGAILPMVAKRLKLDPALMASPLLTTIVDAISLIMYFLIAQLILGL
jgi:magnesium transporter